MPFSTRYRPIQHNGQGQVREGGTGTRMQDLNNAPPPGYRRSTGGSLMDLIRAKADGIYEGSYADFHAGRGVYEKTTGWKG